MNTNDFLSYLRMEMNVVLDSSTEEESRAMIAHLCELIGIVLRYRKATEEIKVLLGE